MQDLQEFTNFYSIYNNDSFETELEKIMTSSSSNKEKIEGLLKIVETKKNQLRNLKEQANKISSLLGNQLVSDLFANIDACISSLDSMTNDLNVMATEINQSNIANLRVHAALTSDRMDLLENIVNKSITVYEDVLYDAVKKETINIKDLEELKKTEHLNVIEQSSIDKVIDRLNKEVQTTQIMAEQPAIKEEKGKESNSVVVYDSEKVKENETDSKMSLNDRLANINYKKGINYAEEVANIRMEYELEQLEEQIKNLKGKDKLSFQEAILLQQLVTQVSNLEESQYNLSFKEQKLEKAMSKQAHKIAKNEEAISLEREKNNSYNSKLFKLLSARREKKLQKQLDKLRSKMIIMQQKQRKSSILSFNKQSNSLMRKAKKQATVQVVSSRTKQKIDELKTLKNNVLEETKNIRADMSQYVHSPQILIRLQEKVGLLAGTSEIQLPVPQEEASILRAA